MSLPLDSEYSPDAIALLTHRAKAALRKRLKSIRAAVPADALAQRSARIVERVIALEYYQRAATVALFAAMPQEVHLDSLAEHAFAQHKHVVAPVVMATEPTLVFRTWMKQPERYALHKSDWGIREPTEQSPVVAYDEIDLLIVAALAVGENGHRLGYGKGHYDRIIPRCTRAKTIVVAFDFQMLAEIPVTERDRACDVVVTDERTIVIS
jgi:5-formyltetrahydrofolate cyclo-ligase